MKFGNRGSAEWVILISIWVIVFAVWGVKEVKQRYEARVRQEQAEKEARERRERKVRIVQKMKEQEIRETRARRAKAERQAKERKERIQTFAVKEAPSLWNAYRNLREELANHEKRINELRETLLEFGISPDEDSDYKRICAMRDEMGLTLQTMWSKMEDAYIASRKFEAAPSRKDYEEQRRKILEDGIREAEAAQRRFDEMRKNK
ncbi:MAG: hypothetical protein IKR48_10185 [Kiritimatiellae bacterium]|nr:hypothetical protein [Kiritimatiellia bacterium]